MSLVAANGALASVLAASSEGGGVTVDFDLVVVGQIVLFLILLFVLKPLLFDPMLKLFEERERRIDGAKVLARKIDERSAGALTKYEEAMQKARAEANAEREKIRNEGLKKEAEILAKVRASTQATLDEGRKQMQGELAQARGALKNEVVTLSKELATRALGREVHG